MSIHPDCMTDHPHYCVNCDRPRDEHAGKRCHFWPWSKAIRCAECDMWTDDEHAWDVHDDQPPVVFEKPQRDSSLRGRAIPKREATR